jgi:hypothetical protein
MANRLGTRNVGSNRAAIAVKTMPFHGIGAATNFAKTAQWRGCGILRPDRHFAAAEVETPATLAMAGKVKPASNGCTVPQYHTGSMNG